MPRKSLIQIRRDTAANWAAVDPVLAAGEPGLDTTNGVLKVGDGSTSWGSLSAANTPQARVVDFTSRRQSAIEAAGALPANLDSLLSLELYAHRGVYDAGGAAAADGEAVATWTDTRPGGLSAVQATAADQPTYIEAAYNSLPALRFGQGADMSVTDTAALRPDSGDLTIFVVARTRTTTTTSPVGNLIAKGNGTSTVEGYSLFVNRSSNTVLTHFRVGGDGGGAGNRGSQTHTISAATDLGKVTLYEHQITGTAVAALVNGAATGVTDGGGGPSAATYTAPINNTDNLVIGNGAAVDIFAILITKGTLTAQQRSQVRRYLMALYPTATVPAACTYASAAEQNVFTTADATQVRIPALARCNSGTILAFAELRAASSDTGYIKIGLRRSVDNGATWGSVISAADNGVDTRGNPVPVVDRSTGRVWLLLAGNLAGDDESEILAATGVDTRRLYVTYSDDDGVTWAATTEITASAKPSGARWVAPGPGGVEQLASGRLLIPCNYSNSSSEYRSYVFYSDDRGVTWGIGGTMDSAGTNEVQIAQLSTGTVVANIRNQVDTNKRYRSASTDNGATWSTPAAVFDLPGPVCQGDILTARGDLLVATSLQEFGATRQNLAVSVSQDAGLSWPAYTVIRAAAAGTSGYSDMVVQGDGRIGVLFEAGTAIKYGTFDLDYPAY